MFMSSEPNRSEPSCARSSQDVPANAASQPRIRSSSTAWPTDSWIWSAICSLPRMRSVASSDGQSSAVSSARASSAIRAALPGRSMLADELPAAGPVLAADPRIGAALRLALADRRRAHRGAALDDVLVDPRAPRSRRTTCGCPRRGGPPRRCRRRARCMVRVALVEQVALLGQRRPTTGPRGTRSTTCPAGRAPGRGPGRRRARASRRGRPRPPARRPAGRPRYRRRGRRRSPSSIRSAHERRRRPAPPGRASRRRRSGGHRLGPELHHAGVGVARARGKSRLDGGGRNVVHGERVASDNRCPRCNLSGRPHSD